MRRLQKGLWPRNQRKTFEGFDNFVNKWQITHPRLIKKIPSINGLFAYLDSPVCMREAIRATNCIESFNASLQRRSSHRVLFSSESNEMIILAACIADYDNAASKKKEKYIAELTEEERHQLGFGNIARTDGKIMVLIIQTQNFLQLSSAPKSRHIKKMAAANKIGAIEDRFDITFSENPADKQAMTFSIQ